MSEIKILDLPEQAAQGQDYALIVKPDGTHVRPNGKGTKVGSTYLIRLVRLYL